MLVSIMELDAQCHQSRRCRARRDAGPMLGQRVVTASERAIPASTRCPPDVAAVLVHRLRRWPNI